MSINETRPLNTTDGWENIVNSNAAQKSAARERVASRKRERKIKKLRTATIATAAVCILFVVLGVTGAVADWLATITAAALLVASSVLFGRYFEARNK